MLDLIVRAAVVQAFGYAREMSIERARQFLADKFPRYDDPATRAFCDFAIAIAVVLIAWWTFYYTLLGVRTRATMQNADMARALGVDTRRIYLLTFGAGSALAGLTGALYAPTTTIVPLMGNQFVDVAFITVVIGGGANPIVGALTSAALLSLISTPLSSVLGTFIGRIGLLIAALVVIRFLPRGISGYLQDIRYRHMARVAS